MNGQLAMRRICPPTSGPISGVIAMTVMSADIICAAVAPE